MEKSFVMQFCNLACGIHVNLLGENLELLLIAAPRCRKPLRERLNLKFNPQNKNWSFVLVLKISKLDLLLWGQQYAGCDTARPCRNDGSLFKYFVHPLPGQSRALHVFHSTGACCQSLAFPESNWRLTSIWQLWRKRGVVVNQLIKNKKKKEKKLNPK